MAVVLASDAPSQLVWVSRAGNIETIAEMPGPVSDGSRDVPGFDLSADGSRAIVTVRRSGYGELWVCDLARGSTSKLFAERADALAAVWTPDGRVIFATLLQGRRWNLWRAAADGGSRPERLTEIDATQNPKSVSRDGRYLVFAQGVGANADLWTLPLDGSGPAAEWLAVGGNQGLGASFSPDGRFLAYESDESGRSEVYVRPFPVGEGRWQVSTDGGRVPAWSASGGEIFYRSRERMMSVKVAVRGKGLEVGAPSSLFALPSASGLTTDFRPSADGQRFLMARHRGGQGLTLVLNWPREAAQLAGRAGK
jgi:Tol biopolymer transport system component